MGAMFLLGLISLALNLAIQHRPFQRYLLDQLADVGGYDLRADDIRLTLEDGLGLVATKLSAHSRRAQHGLFADRVKINLDAASLLRGYLMPTMVEMQSPHIFLTPPPPRAHAKPGAAIKPRVDTVIDFVAQFFLGLEAARLRDARLTVSGLAYHLEKTDITITRHSPAESRRQVELVGQVVSTSGAAPITIQGHFDPTPDTNTPGHPTADLQVSVGATNLAHIDWTRYFSFQQGLARTRFDLKVTGEGRAHISGTLDVDTPRFQASGGRRIDHYALDQAHFTFEGTLWPRAFEFSKIALTTPLADLQVAFGMRWPKSGSPFLKLLVSSAAMPLAQFKEAFPTSTVPQWIEGDLFPIFSGGKARLNKFQLEGPVDRIAGLRRVENADTLGLDIALFEVNAFDDGIGPVVEAVDGEVLIENGALQVSGVRGTSGASVLTEGSLNCPSLYAKPARLIIDVDGHFDLTETIEWQRQPIVPAVIRHQLGLIQTASGMAVGRVGLDFLTNDPRPALSGDMLIQNGRIVHTHLPLPLTVESAQVNLPKEGGGQVTASGQVGGSAVTLAGQVDFSGRLFGLVRKGPDDFKLEASIDLADLVALKHETWWPPALGRWLAGLESAEGHVAAQLHVMQADTDSSLRIGGGLLEGVDLRLIHRPMRLPLQFERSRYEIANDGSAVFSATGAWGDNQFNLAGDAQPHWQQWRLAGSARASLSQILETLWGRHAPRIQAAKPLSAQFEFSGGENALRCQGSIDIADQHLRWGDVVMQPATQTPPAEVALTWRAPSHFTLEKLRLVPSAQGSLSLRGHYTAQTPEGDPAAHFTLNAENVDLAPLGVSDRRRQSALSGNLKGTVTGTYSRGLASLHLDGMLSGDQMILPFAVLPESVNTWGGNLYFSGRKVLLDPLKIELANQDTATIRGGLTGWERISGSLDVAADQIDLDWWRQQFKPAPVVDDGAGRPTTPQRQRPLDVTLSVKTNATLWQGSNLGSLTLEAQLKAEEVQVNSARLDGPGTRVRFSGRYARTPTVSPRFDFKGALNIFEKPLDGLLRGLGVTQKPPTGTASVSGDFAFSGDTPGDLITNGSANLYGIFSEGHIYHANALLDVLEFISLQNIFIRQPSPILRERFFYQQISANVTIANGVLQTKDFLMKSPVFNAGAKGGIDLAAKRLDITFAARPLNTIDFLVSKIPIVGHILTGEDKAVLVYSFKITGPMSDPNVKHIPFNNLDHALIGYFKRIFLTPGRILEQISDQFNSTPPTVADPSATSGGDR